MTGSVTVGLFRSLQARVYFFYLGLVFVVGFASGAATMVLTKLFGITLFLPLVLTTVQTERSFRKAFATAAGILIVIFPYAYRQMGRFGSRMGIGFWEANYFGLALVLLLPVAFVFMRQAPRGPQRTFWTVGVGVMLLEIIFTGSRGAFLGAVLLGLLICLRLTRWRVLYFIVIAALLAAPVVIFPTEMGNRLLASGLDPSVRNWGAEASAKLRADIARVGITMMLQNPLLGVGVGQFKPNVMLYGDVSEAKIAHNTYVEIGAELGIPALLTFLAVLAATLISLRRTERLARAAGNLRMTELAIALQIGMWGWLFSATFLSAEYEKFLWLVVFMSICGERIARQQVRAARVADRPGPVAAVPA
jgi:O-antigen ligase